jgi:ABC-type nickel/cobalt efflux system permease component RcnA
MILKLAQLVGMPTWAIKLGFALIAGLALFWAYSAWRDSVIETHETEVRANVAEVTDDAETEADAELDAAIEDFNAREAQKRKDLQDAQKENRSPLDALFN